MKSLTYFASLFALTCALPQDLGYVPLGLNVTIFEDKDCGGLSALFKIPQHNVIQVPTKNNSPDIQSFKLSRDLRTDEQLDFSVVANGNPCAVWVGTFGVNGRQLAGDATPDHSPLIKGGQCGNLDQKSSCMQLLGQRN